MFDKEELK